MCEQKTVGIPNQSSEVSDLGNESIKVCDTHSHGQQANQLDVDELDLEADDGAQLDLGDFEVESERDSLQQPVDEQRPEFAVALPGNFDDFA